MINMTVTDSGPRRGSVTVMARITDQCPAAGSTGRGARAMIMMSGDSDLAWQSPSRAQAAASESLAQHSDTQW